MDYSDIDIASLSEEIYWLCTFPLLKEHLIQSQTEFENKSLNFTNNNSNNNNNNSNVL